MIAGMTIAIATIGAGMMIETATTGDDTMIVIDDADPLRVVRAALVAVGRARSSA